MITLKDMQYGDSNNYQARINLHYRFSVNKNPWPLWVFDNFYKTGNVKVLEIGCGNGLLWKLNAGRIPRDWEITLSDFSEGMLDDARKNTGDVPGMLNYEVMDAENISYNDRSFDIIIANHMLYHIPDRGRVLSEISRVLKEDGIFYSTTMEHGYMKEMTFLMREYRSVPQGGSTSNSVIKNFSLENGKDQLNEYFKSVELKIYENMLAITEAAPLACYALSLNNIVPGKVVLHENETEKFTEFLNKKITAEGSINIPANAGIFISRV